MRDDLEDLINTTAYRLYKRYRRWVEASDVRQEMWVYVAGLTDERLETIEPGTLRWRLHDAGERYARREKATRSGYSVDDEVYYGLRVIRELLPVAIDDTPVVMRGVDDSQGVTTRRSPPGAGMDYETAVADLRRAYRGLTKERRKVLSDYAEGKDVDEASVTSAMRSMQRKLGGRRPLTQEA